MKINYSIKCGELKGMTVVEAVSQKKFSELNKLKEYLIKSFFSTDEKYHEQIKSEIASIEYYVSTEYAKKMNIILNNFNKYSKETQKMIKRSFANNKEYLHSNDVNYIYNLLDKITDSEKMKKAS